MKEILYSPPLVLLVITVVFAAAAAFLARYAAKAEPTTRTLDAYACGQKNFSDYINPDYNQFFSFAFVFSVMHVLTMVVATAPKDMSALPVCYVLAGVYVIIISVVR